MLFGLFGYGRLEQQSIRSGLCVSCGACAAVCPADKIGGLRQMELGPEPYAARYCERIFCNRCTDVCPAAHVPMTRLERLAFGRNREPVTPEKELGVFRECYVTHTRLPAVDEHAVAGGAVTTLLTYALDTGQIDAAVVVDFDDERPWVAVPKVVTTPEELTAAAGSKYQPHAQILGLKQAVEQGFERIAITAKPCNVHALRKMQLTGRFSDLTDRLALIIGLVCTTHWTVDGTEFLLWHQLGVPVEEVAALTYRARPFPGMFHVTKKDGQVVESPFVSRGYLEHLFRAHQPDACRSCLDGSSELADISVGDCWGHPTLMEETAETGRGMSAVLLRSEYGQALFHQALEAGYLEGEAVPREETFTQNNGAVYRKLYGNTVIRAHRQRHGLPVRRYD